MKEENLTLLFCNESMIPFSDFCQKFPQENVKKNDHQIKKYKSYSNSEKIQFLNLINDIGTKKAAKKMNISWSTAKSWISKAEMFKNNNRSYQEILRKMGTRKKIGVGRKISYPQEIEEKIMEAAIKERESDGKISIKSLKELANIYIKQTKSLNFKGSDGWVKKFIKRNNLELDSLSCPRFIPTDLNLSLNSFLSEFHSLIAYKDSSDSIIFMDEIPIDFGMFRKCKKSKEITIMFSISKK